jgi:DDE superfamily endonuclease
MKNIYNIDKTGINKFCVANIGFAIETSQSLFVVVDSRLRPKYQAEPGRQEWVTVVEYICADGGLIPPLVIFKGENLLTSWIPREVQNDWRFACNSKGWTSNVHYEMWLR